MLKRTQCDTFEIAEVKCLNCGSEHAPKFLKPPVRMKNKGCLLCLISKGGGRRK